MLKITDMIRFITKTIKKLKQTKSKPNYMPCDNKVNIRAYEKILMNLMI